MRSSRSSRTKGPGAARRHDDRDVVLQIGAHAGTVQPHRQAGLFQHSRRPDARMHQDGWRVARRRRDDLAPRLRRSAAGRRADSAAPWRDLRRNQAQHMRAGLHAQVRPPQRRPQIGGRGAAAPSLADRHLQARAAAARCSPPARDGPPARPPSRRRRAADPGSGSAARAGAAAAALGARAVLPVLQPAEIRQGILEAPFIQAIVARQRASPGWPRTKAMALVDELPPTTLPRALDRAAVGVLGRLGVVAPVVQPLLQDLAPAQRHVDQRIAIPGRPPAPARGSPPARSGGWPARSRPNRRRR